MMCGPWLQGSSQKLHILHSFAHMSLVCVHEKLSCFFFLNKKAAIFLFHYKGPFTVSVAISVCVCDLVWVQCRLIGLFTVSVMLIT